MRKPKASDQVWKRVFHQGKVEAFVAHDYPDFYYKVTVQDKRPKYFFGETAWQDYQRYAYDELLVVQ
jgi:hypothetical protein